MVKVVYWPELTTVTMEGHAGAGEAGHDIVCAAASILMYTLAAAASSAKETDIAYAAEIELDRDGQSMIRIKPKARWRNLLRVQMDTVCNGFRLLAGKHPDNVSFDVR